MSLFTLIAFAFLCAALYYICPLRLRWILLLLVSYGYYAYCGLSALPYILTTTLSTWAGALLIGRVGEQNKTYLREHKAELDAALNAANQAYGNASIQCSLDFGRPLATYKYVSCYFGGNGHRGTDYAAPGGTEIYAVSGGVVTAAAYHWSWGYYVQVYHGKDDNGNTYSTLYAHMNSAPVVSVGQPVEKGKVLGYVGSTGNSTGNHLHLEMKVNNVLVNVMNYLS